MTVDNHKNPMMLDLKKGTVPQVTRFNKLAIVLAVIGIVLILGVGILTIQSPHPLTATDSSDHNTIANQEDMAWYQHQSNALPSRLKDKKPTQSNRAVTIEHINSTSGFQTSAKLVEQQEQSYMDALNSPLAPENGELPMSDTAAVPMATPTPPLDPSVRHLPLTEDQIAKLANTFADPNKQAEKQQFIDKYTQMTDGDYLNEPLKKPISPLEIQAGSKIPAILEGGINSDLPGGVTARVRQNVYDTVTGQYLLIPQGTKLIIAYDSNIAYGQERVLPMVKRMLFPNGESMNLEGMPAADREGYAGFQDQVNNHYMKIFGSAVVLAGLSAGFQLSQPQQASALSNPTASQIAAGALGQQMAQVGSSMMNKNLNIQPSIEIRPGYTFIINVTADMVFPHSYTD